MMFSRLNNLTNDSLKTIAKALSTANPYFKNINNQNSFSPFYLSNKQLNAATIGSDLCYILYTNG